MLTVTWRGLIPLGVYFGSAPASMLGCADERVSVLLRPAFGSGLTVSRRRRIVGRRRICGRSRNGRSRNGRSRPGWGDAGGVRRRRRTRISRGCWRPSSGGPVRGVCRMRRGSGWPARSVSRMRRGSGWRPGGGRGRTSGRTRCVGGDDSLAAQHTWPRACGDRRPAVIHRRQLRAVRTGNVLVLCLLRGGRRMLLMSHR